MFLFRFVFFKKKRRPRPNDLANGAAEGMFFKTLLDTFRDHFAALNEKTRCFFVFLLIRGISAHCHLQNPSRTARGFAILRPEHR